MRRTNVWSSKDTIDVVNSSNGLTGVGAVWDWTAALPQGVLNPSQSSNLVKMILRMESASGLDDFANAHFDFHVLSGNTASTTVK